MKTTITQLLKITPEVYDMVVFGNFMKWCNNFAKNDNEVQRLITSPALSKWWITEYHKLEQNFMEQALPYHNALTTQEMTKFYNEEMLQIHHFFSKPLVYCAKHKRQIITANPLHN